ncbi:YhgE/Pip domain-containing protein [Adlercreutzia muris]|uniref:YhgE/Pip domain-containing protein n=1 Tax=Adlercreutzia muris TaxID=1796610 RepID=UPI0035121119
MRNVLKILRRDLLRLVRTPAALVVVVALLVLPSVYTWYNVIGFWNPYDNTGNLTVCVVNQDAGGSSDLTGEMNVGDKIVDQLHENTQLKWEFTDYDSAMDQVRSGEAYAAFVIPEQFTADLLTLTTGDFTQPKLEYYVNEKAGPVSPKITDTGATTLDETVNSTFVSTVTDVAVGAIDEAVDDSRASADETRSRAAEKLSAAIGAVGDARSTLAKIGETAKGAQEKADTAREALGRAGEGIDAAGGTLAELKETSAGLRQTLADFSAFAAPAFGESLTAATDASARARSAAAVLEGAVGQASGGVQAAIAQGNVAVGESRELARAVRSAAEALPEGAERDALAALADTLDERSDAAADTLSSLSGLAQRTEDTSGAVGDAATALDDAVSGATGSMGSYATGLFGTTLPAVDDALEALSSTAAALDASLGDQRLLVEQTGLVIDQLDATMDTARSTVEQTDQLFEGIESELGLVYNDVQAFGASDALARLFGTDGLNAEKIAGFMASPTEVVTESLYPLNAYGSAMAPLFMNLTFWIGAFMLLVIMRQEDDGEGIENLTLGQRYWGRFLLLAAMAALQAVICCAGVLAIGVQAASAPALFAAAVCASLSYLAIIYSFSVTLQHIGKGICIVLVFAQIPGATGLYPIEMTSGFFQAIYPAFPFTYGIGAMREAICGFYGAQYAADLAVLALFFVAFTALGLLLRPLMANVNRMVARQVREGGLFNGEDVDIPVRPYRISQILRALADKDAYGRALKERYARFSRWYPRLMRGAIVAGIAVPVALAVVFALTPAEKVWLLTGWLLWMILLFVALVVVESLRFSFERQMRLESMSDASLLDLYDASVTVASAADLDAGAGTPTCGRDAAAAPPKPAADTDGAGERPAPEGDADAKGGEGRG